MVAFMDVSHTRGRGMPFGTEDAEDEPAVTVDEAMEMLGVSRRTVFKYIAAKKLRKWWREAGSRTMIPIADINELVRPRPRKPDAAPPG